MGELGSSTKNAYLVTSDLHKSYANLSNRINYPAEVAYAESQIIACSKKYNELGYNTVRLSLGDEFHNSYRDVDKAMKDQNDSIALSSVFGLTFMCLGNHDQTYYKNNPLWHLVSKIDSDLITRSRSKAWTPKGNMPYIRLTDRLVDGEVEFIFNHHGTGIQLPDPSKITVGLFHQDIVFRAIMDEAISKFDNIYEVDEDTMKDKHNYVYLDESAQLENYKSCYYGHCHMLYGTWNDDFGTAHNYMASLGRTTHKEVRDDFLERRIGVILVENGKLVGEEFYYFNLLDRDSCVNEAGVVVSQEKYKKTKENKLIKTYSGVSDNPVDNIKSNLGNPFYSRVIDKILSAEPDELFEEFLKYI